ncbi:enoyl-CoA hydratase-related protein, partial [Bordetella bronchiseptica]
MIKVEESGQVAVITYDRGERRNALSLQAMNELIGAADSYRARFDITAIVLAGSANAFS